MRVVPGAIYNNTYAWSRIYVRTLRLAAIMGGGDSSSKQQQQLAAAASSSSSGSGTSGSVCRGFDATEDANHTQCCRAHGGGSRRMFFRRKRWIGLLVSCGSAVSFFWTEPFGISPLFRCPSGSCIAIRNGTFFLQQYLFFCACSRYKPG